MLELYSKASDSLRNCCSTASWAANVLASSRLASSNCRGLGRASNLGNKGQINTAVTRDTAAVATLIAPASQ